MAHLIKLYALSQLSYKTVLFRSQHNWNGMYRAASVTSQGLCNHFCQAKCMVCIEECVYFANKY